MVTRLLVSLLCTRDLKPANLMVGGHHVETPAQRKLLVLELGAVKLADFGLSKSLKLGKAEVDTSTGSNTSKDDSNGQAAASGVADSASSKRKGDTYKLTGETGSYRYMAPEVFRHDLYNHKVDQYAFAMIAYQLFEGVAPFATLNPIQAARCATTDHLRPAWGTKNRWGQEVPQEVKDLIARCWDAKYDTRPEMTEVITALEAVLEKLPTDARGGGGSDDACCTIQ
jgi:serine/threonine protein kinase